LLWRQTIQCLLSSQKCALRVSVKFAPRKLSVGEWYRDGTGVGFCDATTERMLGPSLEIIVVGRFLKTRWRLTQTPYSR
jgi:hypothetical protein